MPSVRFFQFGANVYESDFGWSKFGQLIEGIAKGQYRLQLDLAALGDPNRIQLFVTPAGSNDISAIVVLGGSFSSSSIDTSTLRSFEFSGNDSAGTAITFSGLNLTFGTLAGDLSRSFDGAIASVIGDRFGDVLAGDKGNNRLLGGGGGDVLIGDAGNDVLNGQFAGRDLLVGGTGNDTYTVGVAGVAADTQAPDVVVERAGEGTDQVLSHVSFVLGDNLERLTLLGSENLDGTGNALNNTLIGNSGNNTLDGQGGIDAMAGGAGNDTYIVDVAGDKVSENIAGAAGGADLVQSAASFVLGLNIEQLTLTGSADVNGTGNALANTINGNSGDNRLDGMGGADSMTGGQGDDTYVIDNIGDVVDEQVNGGIDTVVIGRSVNLLTEFDGEIENATLSGTGAFSLTGTDEANVLVGNTGANTLNGGNGDDLLDGKAGADSMVGGIGNDTYVIDSLLDRINDTQGANVLFSSISVNLGSADFSTIAEATLLGSAGLTLTGSNRTDRLNGNPGANRLDGGTNADVMGGGAGNDTYMIDDAGDSVIELLGQGTDTVLTSIGTTLADNVEILTLTTLAVGAELIGNGIANTITGNTGDDTVDGGMGNDTLKCGAGDDVYRVDSSLDVVTELRNQGTDRVESTASFVLGLNIEALTLTGNADINGTGNALANIIIGNSGDNRLDGAGGADNMTGGQGDDTYVVDNVADVVDETTGGGSIDTVVINRSVNLSTDFIDIENATLSGTGTFSVTGTAGGNVLVGNTGANTLTGGQGDDVLDGRSGADSMVGEEGNDAYYVDAASDQVVETTGPNSGNDTVYSSIGFTLVGRNIENIVLLGAAAINATGNDGVNALTGNSGANKLDGGLGADTMTGGVGNDIYMVDNSGDTVVELPGPGVDTVLSTIGITLPDNVEILTLTTATGALLIGNAMANAIQGNDGGDILVGGAGVDTLKGGAGDDVYRVDSSSDVVVELLNQGSDQVEAGASYTLSANIESLALIGTDDIHGTGNALANTLAGNSGNNRLDGAGGIDNMAGGQGDDTYIIDNLGDVVDEQINGGIDTVVLARSANLATDFTEIENATLSGTGAFSLTGTGDDNVLIGNAGANTLASGLGNDVLDGKGGADSLVGGDGNDAYYVDAAGDQVIETDSPDSGNDTIFSSIGFSLIGRNVENLALLGTAALNATGNDGANELTGNSGANRLDGGLGADTMTGGAGNDTYVVGDAGDTIVEQLNQGIDTVLTSVGITLADNVEILTLTTIGAASLIGNGIANTITGNVGADTLDGGAGNDTLKGGAGDDTYIVDSTLDVVTETLAGVAGGNDLVQSSVSFVLGLNIEALTLTGNTDINGTGNALANTIIGNSGDNRLDGMGGADSMTGGQGDDTYVVDNINDVVGEQVNGGIDTVVVARSVDLLSDFGIGIENVTLAGASAFFVMGTSVDNRITGNAAANTLQGGGGNDVLDGKGGADTMAGGAGNDTYYIDSINDQITDIEGSNALFSTVDLDLTQSDFDAIADITLLGNARLLVQGSARGDKVTGNAASNLLAGDDGNDTLLGAGGDDLIIGGNGDDSLQGGDGNDNLIGDDGNDLVDGGTGDDILSGGRGNDTLDGGAGADTLSGGSGDDAYLNVDALDIIAETADGGYDTARSNESMVLGDGAFSIEVIELLGTGNTNAIGSADANTIRGNVGNNLLDGNVGNDTLFGDGGDDTLTGGNGDDRIDGGAGNDILNFDPDDSMLVDGGGGFDTLRFSFSDQTLNLNRPGAVGAEGVYRGIEALDLTGTGNNSVTDLGWQQILTLSDDNRLIVDGNAGDIVTSLAGQGWLQGADQTIGANLYNTWTSNGATLVVDTDVTFTPL